MKNAVFWDVMPFIHHTVLQLMFSGNVPPSSLILSTLFKEDTRSAETSFLKRETRRRIPEDHILHSHRHENLKSYLSLTGSAL
jgi:hypothetical protein